MKLLNMNDHDVWNMMLDYYPDFYCPYNDDSEDINSSQEEDE